MEDNTNEIEVVKHTKWKNEPKLSDLQADFDAARSDHAEVVSQVDKWQSYREVTGKAKPTTRKNYSSVQPKLIRKQAEWRYSSLSDPFLSTPDLFNVYPVGRLDAKRARQNQLILNKQFNVDIDREHFIDDYVHAAVDDGTVIVKLGWLAEDREVTRNVPVYNFIPDLQGQMTQQYQQLMQLQQQDPLAFKDQVDEGLQQGLAMTQKAGIPVIPQLQGYTPTKELVEVVNSPTVDVLNPRNVVIDPSCKGQIKKAKFIVELISTDLSTLQKDGRYFNLEHIRPDENAVNTNPDYATDKLTSAFSFKDKPRKGFVMYEYWGDWDIHGTGMTVPIVASWVGNTLIRLEENPFPDQRHPYVAVPYLFKRESVHGEPDGELLIDNQNTIGAVTRGILDLLGRSANAQTGMQKGMLDAVNKRRYQLGQDYEFQGAGRDPRQGIHTHVYPEVPQSAYNIITLQQNDAESLTGIKAFAGGISGQALGDTNGQVRSALDATSKRELSILRRLARGIIEIGRKIVAMNSEFLKEEEVVRITDTEFIAIKRDDLAGNFDLRLSISTAEEDNAKAQELSFMLQTCGPSDPPELARIIRADIARLRKMPELAHKLETFEPKPDPMAEKMKQMQLMLLQAQIENEMAQAKLHGADAQGTLAQIEETMSKVMLNQAKARDIGSDTDLKDLDYLEQESGVHHARELQKIGHQAEKQAETKMVEAMMRPQPKNK